jgi:hypothetical protein
MLKTELELNKFQYYCLTSVLKPILIDFKEGQQLYRPTGELIEPDGVLVRKEFADTLAYLARRESENFMKERLLIA